MNEELNLWHQTNLANAVRRIVTLMMNENGRSMPCVVKSVAGQIVTVEFNPVDTAPFTLSPVECPKAESPWGYQPTQPGDTGVVIPTDVHIGPISGLGSGIPSILDSPGAFGSLLFVPVGKKGFAPLDANAQQIQGPNGAILRTTQGTESQATVNSSGITLTYGSNSIQIDSNGITLTGGGSTMKIDASGVTLDGILFDTHVHGGVSGGTGTTGGPE